MELCRVADIFKQLTHTHQIFYRQIFRN